MKKSDLNNSLAVTSALNALLEGCELWVVAPFRNSSWTRRINWLSNQMILKGDLPSEFARNRDELQSYFSQWGVDSLGQSPAPKTPWTLFPTSAHLPNRWVLLNPTESLEEWIASSMQCFAGLKAKGIRFFLPNGVTAQQFGDVWRHTAETHKDKVSEVSLVLE